VAISLRITASGDNQKRQTTKKDVCPILEECEIEARATSSTPFRPIKLWIQSERKGEKPSNSFRLCRFILLPVPPPINRRP
jgi:hypothetical protein